MSVLNLLLCLITNMICLYNKITAGNQFSTITKFRVYIMSNDSYRNLSYNAFVNFYSGAELNFLVIDFNFRSYIHQVEVLAIGNDNKLQVTGASFDRFGARYSFFDLSKMIGSLKIYNPKAILRTIGLIGKFTYKSFQFYGYDTFYDKYIGCYRATAGFLEKKMDFANCFKHCRKETSFFGIRHDSCICITSQINLHAVPQKECQQPCLFYNRTICGGEQEYSVYITENVILSSLRSPDFTCLNEIQYCLNCIDGRQGHNCEIIDCKVDNGGCMAKKCDPGFPKFDSMGGICRCPVGTYFARRGLCYDIDECTKIFYCHQFSTTCENIEGGFICNCKDGFERATIYGCRDIDECTRGNLCDSRTTKCDNAYGTYTCNCLPGHARVDSVTCMEVDQCEDSNNKCHQLSTLCVNYKGNISCPCKDGFQRSTYFECFDLDECTERQICDNITTSCVNNPGSYSCDCLPGHSRINPIVCEDIDECESLQHMCLSRTSTCENTIGSYLCLCPEGTLTIIYTHAIICEDIDECKNTFKCEKEISYCLNLEGSYICLCKTGYVSLGENVCDIELSNDTTTKEDYFTSDYEVENSQNTEALLTLIYLFGGIIVCGLVMMLAFGFNNLRKRKGSDTETPPDSIYAGQGKAESPPAFSISSDEKKMRIALGSGYKQERTIGSVYSQRMMKSTESDSSTIASEFSGVGVKGLVKKK